MSRTLVVVLLLLVAGVRVAAAQSDAKALAEQLFQQGKDLSAKGDWAAACPKFEASLRYDPALGTRLNLATCYEKVGKLASAWALFKESVDLARKASDDKRRDFASKRVAALEPRLPRLTITAPPSPPAGFVVTRGGETVDAALFGSAVYVDPGEHEIVASAPGHEPYTTKIVVEEWKQADVVIPALTPSKPEPDTDTDTDTGLTTDHAKPDDSTDVVVDTGPAPSKARRTIGLVTLGVGVAATGAGLYFGLGARSTYDDAKAACGGDLGCDSQADLDRSQGLVDDARSKATIATVLTGVGVAAVATGAILWLTAPSGDARPQSALRITPVLAGNHAELVLGGSF
jgi:hypothetical protein